ncbi:hypothetical protein CARUB_v10007785mg [Capsella rubella]|uniref:TF-B3 domain-containing protein n=1 Tax=Capsella rubella TaxID=81985 RepID=R0FBI1_9BRAS|nr:uncharacterized protein LOC17877554 [Capsella rubella]EOA19116.1 hypothetical protein CARUB_v10007785mg [Capsella rubella]
MAESSSSSTLKKICEENKKSLWKIRQIVTEKSKDRLDFDNNNDFENHILRPLGKLSEVKQVPITIKIDDYDKATQHDVMFGYDRNSDVYYIDEALFRLKKLSVGDEIGLFYDTISGKVCFSVLKKALP